MNPPYSVVVESPLTRTLAPTSLAVAVPAQRYGESTEGRQRPPPRALFQNDRGRGLYSHRGIPVPFVGFTARIHQQAIGRPRGSERGHTEARNPEVQRVRTRVA